MQGPKYFPTPCRGSVWGTVYYGKESGGMILSLNPEINKSGNHMYCSLNS